VFLTRIDEAITQPFEESIRLKTPVQIQENGLEFKDVSVAWKSETCVLKNVNFKFKDGDKIAVVGRVASGKTSLLLSILGELRTTCGEISHSGNVSFAE
jgi:ABC-type transport system involved in cytochrome bd biosynthesis fused ATPase/permease subunit